MSSPYKIFAVATNIISFIVLLISIHVFDKLLPPFHRGFFCDDKSIQKPYVENETIEYYLLLALVVMVILLTIIICDVYNYMQSNRNSNCDNITIKVLDKINIKQWIYRDGLRTCFNLGTTLKWRKKACSKIFARIFLALAGFAMCVILSDIGKVMVGRLRPHFLAVCKPDYTKFNCSDGYIDFNVCTTTDEIHLERARQSFPSSHASISAYASLFFALYIQYVIQPRQFFLLIPFVQFFGICLGVACGFTRISDYYHHGSDVLVGYIIGAIISFYTIFVLMNVHYEEKIIADERRDNDSHDENQESLTSFVASSDQPNYKTLNKD